MESAPLFISGSEVKKALENLEDLITVIQDGFSHFSKGPSGGVVQPVRSIIVVPEHKTYLGVMPAYSQSEEALATKIVTFNPNNTTIPTHNAIIVLNDVKTGLVKAVMDGEVITTLRTAAASLVATKFLCNRKPKILAILGSGEQALSHYKLFSHQYKFEEVRVWSRTLARAEKCANLIGGKAFDSVEATVKDADVIITVTAATEPVLMKEWVKPGAHINAVGSCRPYWNEIDPKLVNDSVVYVDSKEGALKEAGDIILAKAEIYAEIGEVINGTKEGRINKTTLFKSLGMAVEDILSANLVYEKIMAKS